MGGKSEAQREQSRQPTPRTRPEQDAEVGGTALPAVRHICRRFPGSLGTGLFQAHFTWNLPYVAEKSWHGVTVYFWKWKERNLFGALHSSIKHRHALQMLPAAAPPAAPQHSPCSGTSPWPSSPLPSPPPVLTFLAPSSMGARHSGALLRTLLTKVDTGWKTMFSVGWMSLTASWVGTSAKSSHFPMASSPSRMAGILGDKTVSAKAQCRYGRARWQKPGL